MDKFRPTRTAVNEGEVLEPVFEVTGQLALVGNDERGGVVLHRRGHLRTSCLVRGGRVCDQPKSLVRDIRDVRVSGIQHTSCIAGLLGKQSVRGIEALPEGVQGPIQLLVLRSTVGGRGAVELRRPRSKIERVPWVLKRVKGVGRSGLGL